MDVADLIPVRSRLKEHSARTICDRQQVPVTGAAEVKPKLPLLS